MTIVITCKRTVLIIEARCAAPGFTKPLLNAVLAGAREVLTPRSDLITPCIGTVADRGPLATTVVATQLAATPADAYLVLNLWNEGITPASTIAWSRKEKGRQVRCAGNLKQLGVGDLLIGHGSCPIVLLFLTF